MILRSPSPFPAKPARSDAMRQASADIPRQGSRRHTIFRRTAAGFRPMQRVSASHDGVDDLRTKASGNLDFYASLLFAKKKRSYGNRCLQHFFQTECLKTELCFVSIKIFCRPALVFHGVWPPVSRCLGQSDALLTIGDAMKLDDIGYAGNAKFVGTKPDGTDDANGPARFPDPTVGFLMQKRSLGCETVVGPLLLDMKERKPPGAMDVLPHSGQGKQLLFGIQGGRLSLWDYTPRTCNLTPFGRLSSVQVLTTS